MLPDYPINCLNADNSFIIDGSLIDLKSYHKRNSQSLLHFKAFEDLIALIWFEYKGLNGREDLDWRLVPP